MPFLPPNQQRQSTEGTNFASANTWSKNFPMTSNQWTRRSATVIIHIRTTLKLRRYYVIMWTTQRLPYSNKPFLHARHVYWKFSVNRGLTLAQYRDEDRVGGCHRRGTARCVVSVRQVLNSAANVTVSCWQPNWQGWTQTCQFYKS